MKLKTGENYLITTNNWFFAPDGQNYTAVWGTVYDVVDSKQSLGVDTNRHSTNWYIMIGDMMVAGCQVYYAVRSDDVETSFYNSENSHEGVLINTPAMPRIYDANKSGKVAGE